MSPVRRGTLYRLTDPADHSSPVDVAVVGAGAAGLATAIFARRAAPTRGVLLLEGARRPGAKILVSGGSRCNVTNARVDERDFWGGPSTIVRRVLRAFRVDDTVAFFREIGVHLHEEADGKLFPDTNRSRDVLEALLNEVDRVGVTLVAGQRVLDVTRAEKLFHITTTSGVHLARAVVLATGGQSLPKTGSDGFGFALARRLGHTIVPPTPGLVPLLLSPQHLENLANLGNLENRAWEPRYFRCLPRRRAHHLGGRARRDPPERSPSLDAFRRERPGSDERVAALAQRTTRGSERRDHDQFPRRRTVRRRRCGVDRSRPRATEGVAAARAVSDGAGVGRGGSGRRTATRRQP